MIGSGFGFQKGVTAMRSRALAGLLLSTLGALILGACGGSSSTPTAPAITTQPTSLTVLAGQTATFKVVAVGAAPLSYQWQKNGSDISGATSATYTTPATAATDNGSQFKVVVNNSVGSATSNPATLMVSTTMSAADVVTYHNDNARTGQNLAETLLNPGNVNATSFGKVGFFSVDGKVDAQPLYLSNVTIPGQGAHNILYVVTEPDSVYAFDAASGAVLWHVSLLAAGETTSDTRSCGQVTPEIGITATPVIDRTRGPNGAIYVIAMSKSGSNYFQRLHALDITTGAELFGGPKNIQASFPGTGDGSSGGNMIFDPKQYEERAGMLLLNGVVYTGWTSHCDIRPYTGWIMAYDASTLAQTSVLNVTPNGNEGAIWMAGAGLAADSSANIYFLDANGSFDTTLNAGGFPSQGDFGNAFVKLSTSGGLAVADYFATFDTVSQSAADNDLGSGGALVLPDLTNGSGQVQHLAVGTGKDGNIYVVNRDAMGKFNPSSNNIYQQLSGVLSGSVFSMPAYFNNTLYYGAVGDRIKAFAITSARLSSAPTGQTSNSFPYPGATPGISANGSANAILWAVENGGTAVLHAYDATDLSHELYNSNQSGSRDQFGAGNKFITPTLANGRVYVGTTNGVAVLGLLP
jgi:hypothetical protein